MKSRSCCKAVLSTVPLAAEVWILKQISSGRRNLWTTSSERNRWHSFSPLTLVLSLLVLRESPSPFTAPLEVWEVLRSSRVSRYKCSNVAWLRASTNWEKYERATRSCSVSERLIDKRDLWGGGLSAVNVNFY